MISESEFSKICKDGDIELVKSAIRDIKANGKKCDRYWHSGLKGACKRGRLDVVKLIIKQGVYHVFLNDVFPDACLNGNMDIVKLMIQHGANNWNSALSGACYGGHMNIVKLMIKKGADDMNWGLNMACSGGHLDVIKLMIERGAYNLHMIVHIYSNLMDHDIATLMVKRNIFLEKDTQYPRNATAIFKLYAYGLPIDNFKKIDGFKNFIKDIEKRRNHVKNVLTDHLVKDLIGITNEYIIN